MSHKEKLLQLYSRTYRNCQFYAEHSENEKLLNEIGVLRGIAYSIEAIVGGRESLFQYIDFASFDVMIKAQNKLRNVEKSA